MIQRSLICMFCIAFGLAINATVSAAEAVNNSEVVNASKNNGGFIQRWWILEPIETRGLSDSQVRATVNKEYFADQMTVTPKDGEKVIIEGKDYVWHEVTTDDYNVNLFHFAAKLDKPTSNVLFWIYTTIEVNEEMTDVRLAIGSNAASVWWVNAQEVISLFNDRQTVIDDGVSKRLRLAKGRNVIRAAVINAGGATDFCARLLDASDNPITTFDVVSPQ